MRYSEQTNYHPKGVFMNKTSKWPQKTILVPVLAALITLAACGTEERTAEAPEPKTVAWIKLDGMEDRIDRNLSGVVRPAETAQVSFEIPGKVETVNVSLGERFAKDDVLAALDDTVYKLAVNQRTAELSEARARMDEARRDYNRKRKLIKANAISRADYDLAKTSFEAAKNQVAAAEARLELAREDLADARIVAPYDGSVSKRYIEPSQRVSPGQVAFEIQGDQRLEIAVSVPETMIGELEIGAVEVVKFPVHPDKEALVEITEIGTRAESANAFPVTLTLKTPQPGLRPGMTAEVNFAPTPLNGDGKAASDDAGLIPIPVTAFEAGPEQKHYVFKYEPESRTIAAKTVTIANISGRYGYVSDGLEKGDIIVKAGLPFLRDGQKVTLLDADVRTYNE